VYARYLPWIENNVPLVKDTPYPINIDGNYAAYSVRIVNAKGDATIYYRRDSTIDRTNFEGVVRSGGAVLNFPEPVRLMSLLSDRTTTVDITISADPLPDIAQAQEITRWGDTQMNTLMLSQFITGGALFFPSATDVYPMMDWAGIELLGGGGDSVHGDFNFEVDWYYGNFITGAPLFTDSFDLKDMSLVQASGAARFDTFIPARTPFFRIGIFGSTQLSLSAWFLYSNRMRSYQYGQNNNLLYNVTGSVGAGVTRTDYLAPYVGPVKLAYRTQAAASELDVFQYDFQGNLLAELYRNVNPSANDGHQVELFLPKGIVRIDSINNDASSRVFRVAVNTIQ